MLKTIHGHPLQNRQPLGAHPKMEDFYGFLGICQPMVFDFVAKQGRRLTLQNWGCQPPRFCRGNCKEDVFDVFFWHRFSLLSLVPLGLGLSQVLRSRCKPCGTPKGTKESKQNRCQQDTSAQLRNNEEPVNRMKAFATPPVNRVKAFESASTF